MAPITLQPISPASAAPVNGGMTLLEAYSALAKKARTTNTAIDAPSPGRFAQGDCESDFWHLRLKISGLNPPS